MATSKYREKYRLIRYDYYHAGRLLYLIGNFHSAGIMLGYTVETTMKAGMMEVMSVEQQQGDRILNQSHDVRQIWKQCRRLGLFNDVTVSVDFLEHVNNNFQRYPSQMSKILERSLRKQTVLGNSADWVYYYDDLVVQLDSHLMHRTGDPSISMVYHVFRTLETRYARDILRENAFALLKFEEYAALVRQNMPEREDLGKQIDSNLSKGSAFYWNTDSPVAVTREQIVNVANTYTASTFQLSKWKTANGWLEAVIP